VPRVHSTYDALLADPSIDAIYNPLPNNLHAAWSIRAVEAGKHVLCEKPLATSAREARLMFEAAERSGVYLAEAYPYRSQPLTARMLEVVRDGSIGILRSVHASFGFSLTDPAAMKIRMDPSLAGGALMDAGCYPISLVRTVVNERPVRVHAIANRSESGVDTALMGTFQYASGILAQISCSFASSRSRFAHIVGANGGVDTAYYNDTSDLLPPTFEVKRGIGWDAPRETIVAASMNGFLAEADAFHDLVAEGWASWTGVTPQDSVEIALIVEALAQSAREHREIEIDS
jgi:predicted dehydrogenase